MSTLASVGGAVRAGVVDDDHLELGVGLLEDRVDTLGEQLAGVVVDDDDGAATQRFRILSMTPPIPARSRAIRMRRLARDSSGRLPLMGFAPR